MKKAALLLAVCCIGVLPVSANLIAGDSLITQLKSVSQPAARAKLYEEITRYYQRRSLDTYTRYLLLAYQELENKPDSGLQVNGAIYHARHMILEGKIGEGMELLQAQAKRAERLGLTDEEYRARKALMGCLRSVGRLDLVLEEADIALKKVPKSQPERWAEVWFIKGTAHLAMQEWDLALVAYNHSLELRDSLSQSLLGDIYQGLGMAYRGKGFYKKGQDYYFIAEKAFESVGDIYGLFFIKTEMAADYGNLGAIYQAKKIAEEAEKLARLYNNERMLISTTYLLSGFEAELKQFAKARKTLAQLKALATKQLPDSITMGFYYLSLSTLMAAEGKYDSAFTVISRARHLYQQLQFPHYEHQAYLQIFSIYTQIFEDADTLNDLKYVYAPTPLGYPDLITLCKEEIIRQEKNPAMQPGLYQLYGVLVEAYRASGKYVEAQQAVEIYDSLKNKYFNSAYLFIKDASEQEYRLVLQERDFQMAAQEAKIAFQDQMILRDKKIKWLTGIALVIAIIFAVVLFILLSRLRKSSRKLFQLNQELTRSQQVLLSQKEAIEEQNNTITRQRDQIQSQLERKDRELASQLLIMQQYTSHIHETQKSIRSSISQQPHAAISDTLKEVMEKLNEMSHADYGWDTFRLQYEEVHPDFFAHLLRRHPDLTSTDLKHCALIHLGLSNKEKAQLMNLTYKGIDSANYRIKKKLNLDPEAQLANYLMKIGI